MLNTVLPWGYEVDILEIYVQLNSVMYSILATLMLTVASQFCVLKSTNKLLKETINCTSNLRIEKYYFIQVFLIYLGP